MYRLQAHSLSFMRAKHAFYQLIYTPLNANM